MRRLCALLLLNLFAGTAAAGPLELPVIGLKRGEAFPDLAFTAPQGPRHLSDVTGMRFVTFWSTTCTPCLGELAEIEGGLSSGRHDDVQFIALNLMDTPAAIEATLTKHGSFSGQWGVVEDIVVATTVATAGVPLSFVLDGQGTVLATHSGYRPGRVDKLLAKARAVHARELRRSARAEDEDPG